MLASIRRFFSRLIGITHRRKLLGSLDKELEFHLEMETLENTQQGMKPEEARRRAFVALGGVDSIRETYRETGSFQWFGLFARDIRHGLRMLVRNPLQSMIIVGVLSLGMAGVMTVFNLINAVFLRPLPVEDQSRIMNLSEIDPATGNEHAVPYFRFHAWRQYNQSFDAMAFSSQFRTNISHGGTADNVNVRHVTYEFFDVLDIHPVLGRTFTAEEDRPGLKPVLLGEGLWKRMFNGDPAILGQSVLLDGNPSGPVIGILPDTTFPDRKEVWLPLGADPESDGGIGPMAVGRLKKGVAIEKAKADLSRIQKNWADQHPDRGDTPLPKVIPLRDAFLGSMGETRFALFVAFAIVVLVLVIACCNVTGSMLSRSTHRSHELAIRATLGASRGHIMRQVFTESLVLAIAGSLLGVILGWHTLQFLLYFLGSEIPNWMNFTADIHCILFGTLLVVVTTLLCGLLPALHASKSRGLHGVLQSASTRTSGSPGKRRTLDAIIAAQLALSMTLLVGAGLVLRTYLKVQLVDPGFRTTGIITYHVPLSITAYLNENKRHAFWEQHIEKVRALPGVTHAALVNALPLSFPEIGLFETDDLQNPLDENAQVFIRRITPGYFETLDIPLLSGRDFSEKDNLQNSEATAIVDRRFARQFWPGDNPIDKRIRMLTSQDSVGVRARNSKDWIRIIGVVQDTRQISLDERRMPGIYLPRATTASFGMYAVVRTFGEPLALVPSLRKSVQSLDTGVPVDQITTLANHVHESTLNRRLALWIYGTPALVAAILAFVGIYGITSYAVSQRTREIGIRIALGAQKREVLCLVIGHAFRLVLFGLIPGLLGAVVLGQILASMQQMLYDVGSIDPLTLGGVFLLLTAGAVLSSYVPAYKAMKIDPISALRYE